MLDLIREMTADGKTVVMCTHLLVEAEGLADQIVVMEAGHALCTGTPDELIRALLARRHGPARRRGPDQPRPPRPHDRGHRLRRAPTWPASNSTTSAGCPTSSLGLAHDGVRLTRVEPHVPTLEDLYFAVRRAELLAGRPLPTLDLPFPGFRPRQRPRSGRFDDRHGGPADHEEVSA
ncbi:MAG: hypothetical protein V9G12_09440 [Microthrixaceae bacterium]